MSDKRELGLEGEEIAVGFLKGKGYRILERNYRTKAGEIDIIAQKKKTIIFVEVKTRGSDKFGSPVEAVNNRKLSKLFTVASQYIQKHRFANCSIRFEVVSVVIQGNNWDCEIIPAN
ncbi:MAG: YraN family protein [bacterium]|nr:YraN family protein [bacterium]